MNVEFKPYVAANRDYVFSSYAFAMRRYIEKIWGWDQRWQEENFSQSLDRYQTLILCLDKERAGYIQYEHTPEFTFLSMIVLAPKFQSLGYGAKILSKIQELNPELPIKLRCFRVNRLAYRFYVNNGFKEVAVDNEFHTLVRLLTI